MSSPSAILWFAAVGGALIAKAGATTPATASVFLSGFSSAASRGHSSCARSQARPQARGCRADARACHVASALLFAYFSYSVIVGGYRDLIVHAV